ncbi:hypothetical protein Agau_L101559 [Agrobacterium tumefaciens F2]|nr:hypothetical protein Agau_L101559 [Agrobacterium tumefaciens F2]
MISSKLAKPSFRSRTMGAPKAEIAVLSGSDYRKRQGQKSRHLRIAIDISFTPAILGRP